MQTAHKTAGRTRLASLCKWHKIQRRRCNCTANPNNKTCCHTYLWFTRFELERFCIPLVHCLLGYNIDKSLLGKFLNELCVWGVGLSWTLLRVWIRLDVFLDQFCGNVSNSYGLKHTSININLLQKNTKSRCGPWYNIVFILSMSPNEKQILIIKHFGHLQRQFSTFHTLDPYFNSLE